MVDFKWTCMDNFKWTDELVIEYGLQVKSKIDIAADMEKFKASKQPILDYEILSIWQDGTTNWSCIKETFNYYLKNSWHISQVKRLSDNSIYTVGDRVGCVLNNDTFFIETIDISTGEVYLMAKDYLLPLRNAIKTVKQPLFTTEDGKEIFDNDEIVWVVEKETYDYWSTNAKSCSGSKIYFSTEEKAKRFVAYFKPMFSAKEIFSVSAKYGSPLVQFERDIEELIKSKIK